MLPADCPHEKIIYSAGFSPGHPLRKNPSVSIFRLNGKYAGLKVPNYVITARG
jgi:hypothetical protein